MSRFLFLLSSSTTFLISAKSTMRDSCRSLRLVSSLRFNGQLSLKVPSKHMSVAISVAVVAKIRNKHPLII